MSRGEVLGLIDDSKTWWKVKNRAGQIGYVPSNYIIRTKKGGKTTALAKYLNLRSNFREVILNNKTPTVF